MPPTPPQVTFYVLLPSQGGGTPAPRPIARLLQEEEATVKRKLETPTYEVLARFAKRANAEGLGNQLNALGLSTVTVSDQDIRGHLFLSVASANRGAGGMAFKDFDGKPLYCPYEDVLGVVLLEVRRQDGSLALVIDLHRRSTNITPRLDAALFDFPSLLQRPGAGVQDLLAELESKARIVVDRRFGSHREQLIAAGADFGSRPVDLAPPPSKLAAPHEKTDRDASNHYSFVLYTFLKQG